MIRIPWPENDLRAGTVHAAVNAGGHWSRTDIEPGAQLQVIVKWNGRRMQASELPIDRFLDAPVPYYPKVDEIVLRIHYGDGTHRDVPASMTPGPEPEAIGSLEDVVIISVLDDTPPVKVIVDLLEQALFDPEGMENRCDFRDRAEMVARRQIHEREEDWRRSQGIALARIVYWTIGDLLPAGTRAIIHSERDTTSCELVTNTRQTNPEHLRTTSQCGAVFVHDGMGAGILVPNGIRGRGQPGVDRGPRSDRSGSGNEVAPDRGPDPDRKRRSLDQPHGCRDPSEPQADRWTLERGRR